MQHKNKQSAFTLIELMIVIAIVGILMAYAIPAYQNYVTRSLLNEGNIIAAGYKTSVSTAYQERASLIGLNNSVFGIGPVNAEGYCVDNIIVTDGQIVIGFDCGTGSRGKANTVVDVQTITWKPVALNANSGTSLQWECFSSALNAEYNPCP